MDPDLNAMAPALQQIAAALEKGWWDYITTAAVVLTLIVLIWYTIETCRLREAAQIQNELALMPVLIIRFESADRRLGEPKRLLPIQVRNIGKGPAFNVFIKSFGIPPIEVNFEPVPVLEPAA